MFDFWSSEKERTTLSKIYFRWDKPRLNQLHLHCTIYIQIEQFSIEKMKISFYYT